MSWFYNTGGFSRSQRIAWKVKFFCSIRTNEMPFCARKKVEKGSPSSSPNSNDKIVWKFIWMFLGHVSGPYDAKTTRHRQSKLARRKATLSLQIREHLAIHRSSSYLHYYAVHDCTPLGTLLDIRSSLQVKWTNQTIEQRAELQSPTIMFSQVNQQKTIEEKGDLPRPWCLNCPKLLATTKWKTWNEYWKAMREKNVPSLDLPMEHVASV